MSLGSFARSLTVAAGTAAAAAACSGTRNGSPAVDTDALIAEVCNKLAALACATPATKQSCLDDLLVRLADAKQEGCEVEVDVYLQCANGNSVICDGGDEYGQPEVSSKCDAARQGFDACYTGLYGDCSVAIAPGPGVKCEIKCTDLSSSCVASSSAGPVSCVCDTGPHAGKSFQASDCDKNLSWATGHNCS